MSRTEELKKNRNKMFESLTQAAEKFKTSSTSKETDDRFWRPTTDKAGNAYAIIRFLPTCNGDELPWVRVYAHGFQNKATGAWLIENCPTTVNLKCPVCESNTLLWNSGIEKNKNVARDRKRKLSYVSNILVVNDPACPENEGKVFLFKYGKKIFDKLTEVMAPPPEYPDENPMNPFCPWEGANFKLKVRKFEGYTNYDKSSFEESSVLSDEDSEIESVLGQQSLLNEFVDPKQFKNYDDIKTRLNTVLSDLIQTQETSSEEEEDDLPSSFTQPKTVENIALKTKKPVDDEDGEDMSSFFGLKKEKEKRQDLPLKKKASRFDDDDDDQTEFLKRLASEDD